MDTISNNTNNYIIRQIDSETNQTIKDWSCSIREIARQLNISVPAISYVINGKRKTAGGFIFRKIDVNTNVNTNEDVNTVNTNVNTVIFEVRSLEEAKKHLFQHFQFQPCGQKCPYKNGCVRKLGYYEIIKDGMIGLTSCHFRSSYQNIVNYIAYCKNNGLDSKETHTFLEYKGTKSVASRNRLMELTYEPETMLGTNFYVYGPNGCQKTSMVTEMARRIAETFFATGKTIYMSSMSHLTSTLKTERDSEYSNDEQFKANAKYDAEKYRNADILILDESFDSTKMRTYKSGYGLDALDNFIRNRMKSPLQTTFFISNIHPESIDENLFDCSIKDLIDRDTEKLEFIDRYDAIPVRQIN